METGELKTLKINLEDYAVLQVIINKTYYTLRNYIYPKSIEKLINMEYIRSNGNTYEITHKLKELIKCPYTFEQFYDKWLLEARKQQTKYLKTDTKETKTKWFKLSSADQMIAFESIELFMKWSIASWSHINNYTLPKAKSYLEKELFHNDMDLSETTAGKKRKTSNLVTND